MACLAACSSTNPVGPHDTAVTETAASDGPPSHSDLDSAIANDRSVTDQLSADVSGDSDVSGDLFLYKDLGSGWSCQQVYECVKKCIDVTCIQSCQSKACPSAVPVVNKLINCAFTFCGSPCLSGNVPQCESCLHSKCTQQLVACQNHSC
jgi:hypothetical protein